MEVGTAIAPHVHEDLGINPRKLGLSKVGLCDLDDAALVNDKLSLYLPRVLVLVLVPCPKCGPRRRRLLAKLPVQVAELFNKFSCGG
jgi:hypothetical protein